MLSKQTAKKVKPKISWVNTSFGPSEDIENETSDSDIEIVETVSNSTDAKVKPSPTVRSSRYNPSVNLTSMTVPMKREELAVNKKKVDDVEDWLSKAISNSSTKPMILHMTGPTGAGKTTTIHVLANSKNIHIVEWTNPMDDFNDNEERHSGLGQASKFEDFLIASARYHSVIGHQHSTKLIIVEDYPNALILKPELFHEIIRKYRHMGKSPLVFITTEVNSGKNISMALFPPQFISELGIQHISFNPIASTSLVKALVHVLKKENQPDISAETINGICQACNGDVRNAMLELRYLTQDGSRNSYTKRSAPSRPVGLPASRKRKADVTKRKSSNDVDNKTCKRSGKDFLTGIMHSVGRVLHGKRDKNIIGGGNVDSDKRGYLKSNPQEIINQFLSQHNHFVSLTHENYLSIFSDIHSACKAAENLCDADVIMSEWKEKDILKEMGFSVAVRGIMNASNNPIRRWNPIQKSKWKDIRLETDQYLRNLQSSASMTFSTRALCMDFAPFDGSNVRSNPYNGTVPVKTIDSTPVSPLPHITDDDSD